ncbi:MAG: tetratricopeptide repeat protein [Bacteroidota bacterium]
MRIVTFIAALVIASNFGHAQQDQECMLNLTLLSDYYKSKKYDEAYEPWKKLRTDCPPKFNRLVYQGGEKILDHKIDNSSGAEKLAFIEEYMKLMDDANPNFPKKYPMGEIIEKKGNMMYDNQKELNKSDMDIYNVYDKAYTQDPNNFTSTKGLYVYFVKTVDLFKAGEFDLQKVFDKYDDISEQLEKLNEDFTQKVNKLVEKEEAGQKLTKKEEQLKKYYFAKIEANDKISGSLDTYLGQLADCENLIPLYEKQFEEKKTDAQWLKRAVSRMYNKECIDAPLYVELVKAYDAASPSADTKYFLATILFKNGNNKEAEAYLKESYDLTVDKLKKAKLAKRIANNFKKRGSFGTARNYYREALKLNPSDGTPYLYIAAMYAKSANNCGDTNFNKRAVFWYAANEARKAGQVDPNLKGTAAKTAASYEGNAPTKGEIFTEQMSGKKIEIGCWIRGSVTVPKID